jgi:hypothetical protein
MTADERGQLWIAGADVWHWADCSWMLADARRAVFKTACGFGIQKAANDWPGRGPRASFICVVPRDKAGEAAMWCSNQSRRDFYQQSNTDQQMSFRNR